MKNIFDLPAYGAHGLARLPDQEVGSRHVFVHVGGIAGHVK